MEAKITSRIVLALQRARFAIFTVGLTYALAVLAGMILVHAGNGWALAQRDKMIAQAAASSQTLVALDRGDRLRAALLDFGGNLAAGVGSTVGGIGVVATYPVFAYRGWIGGIVSVDGAHASRLANLPEAAYYLSTLLLQLIPYTLAGGMGVNLGLAWLRPRACYQGKKWLGLPQEAIYDVLRVYILIVPLFLLAALWEFLLR